MNERKSGSKVWALLSVLADGALGSQEDIGDRENNVIYDNEDSSSNRETNYRLRDFCLVDLGPTPRGLIVDTLERLEGKGV